MNGRALSILDEDIPGLSVAHYVYDRQPDSSNNGKFGYVLILAILRMIDYYRWMKIK